MTEANPPDKLSDLGRRILFLLKEKDRRGDYPYLFQIASDLEETREDIKDQLDILKDLGLAEVTFFIGGDAQPFITGTGKLELEQWGQATPVTGSPPSSEPQEFDHSPDYATVIWRGREFHFSPMQSHAVRLLHKEFQEGRNDLRDAYVIETIEAKVRTLHDLFKRSCGVWDKLIIKGERQGTHRLNLSRQVPPDSN